MKRRRTAYTLMETLVVLAITAAIAGITFPVIAQAKRSGMKTASIAQMRQLFIATQIYRADYGGSDSNWSSTFALGLPLDHTCLIDYFGQSEKEWKSPFPADYQVFAGSPGGEYGHINYCAAGYISQGNGYYQQQHYLERYRENAVLFNDVYCNPPGTPMNDPFVPKRALAILFSGALYDRKKYGVAAKLEFYSGLPDAKEN